MTSSTMDRKSGVSQDALAMLKKDHEKVKKLFTEFEGAKNFQQKQNIAQDIIAELKVHANVEENLFYPAVRQEIKEQELMEEADEEHHVAKVLIAELEKMTGKEDHYEAKVMVLAENIRHHIKEEEGEMFPEARKTAIDFKALGERMQELKEKLQEEGVPEDAEARMVEQSGLRGDSPAKNAQKTIEVPKKAKSGGR
jgi:hypothetical protein